MLTMKSLFYWLLEFQITFFVRFKIISDELSKYVYPNNQESESNQPIFYVIRHQSASDIITLKQACQRLGLPDPLSKVNINGECFYRTLCIEKPNPLFTWQEKQPTSAINQSVQLLEQHDLDPSLNVQLIPANIIWGRTANKVNKRQRFSSLPANVESPSWLKKMFIVLLLGRHALIRFSDAIPFREIADHHGSDAQAAKKLLRIARVHFRKQILAATGPSLLSRKQVFQQLQINPAVKKAISEEANRQNISEKQVEKQALKLMDEIAGDYSDAMVRLGDRVLAWLWNKLYQGIQVSNAKPIRKLAQQGHEIIYVPCHRSHMDYLLLTYVIFQQGLVTPRSAAGINLSFWPAGPIFRKAGAFFIRRSFKGDPLYSTIFREYLSLLFERGYPVKFYTEGGRSRTGRLLPPKTGMLAMTVQSMLRGIERPITLVPVYLGYEHVMEVGSYHKELSGTKKKEESIFGVVRAIKNLKNYGKGYVNFGQPINVKDFLDEKKPDWQQDIDPINTLKPDWLNGVVNQLSQTVMTSINQNAAINGVALVAIILHNTKNNALAQQELKEQIDFFLKMQKHVPYTKHVTFPTESAEELLTQVIQLNKVEVYSDSFGDVISLTPASALDMRYYRNNIIHCYMLHAIICRLLDKHEKIHNDDLIKQVNIIISLTKNELFLAQTELEIIKSTQQILGFLTEAELIKRTTAGFWSKSNSIAVKLKIHSMGECIHETLQRIMMVIKTTHKSQQDNLPLNENQLAERIVEIAKRLSLLNQVNAPEFIDKKTQAILIKAMINNHYIEKEDNLLTTGRNLTLLSDIVLPLISTNSLQSIIRS